MKLVFKYLATHLKVSLEYKASLLLSLISQVFMMFIELFTIEALFIKFGLLDTYNVYELLLGFSVVWAGFSISEMIFRGFDQFSKLIIKGNFDILLIRPRNIFLQVFGSDICYEKFSRVVVALIIYVYSSFKVISNFSIDKVLLLILMLLGCVIIFLSIFILGASFCFITIQGLEFINIFTDGSRQLSQYPMGIYKKIVRVIFTYIIPITLVNYYPIKYLTNEVNNYFYLVLPLLSIIFLLFSIFIFNLGIKKYSSSGS